MKSVKFAIDTRAIVFHLSQIEKQICARPLFSDIFIQNIAHIDDCKISVRHSKSLILFLHGCTPFLALLEY